MQVIREFSQLQLEINRAKEKKQVIGFVPTMGFLHEGHLSLLIEARKQTDFVVLSIFVNPIQFGEGEDYEEYPRDLESDTRKAEEVGCDLLFYPRTNDMYPRGYATYVDVEKLTSKLCGVSRAGHFRGVTTVVNKLFNLVQPDKAFFGQKDAQQVVVIKKMVEDLNINLEVIVCPTVREADGLAMSSRNSYLGDEQREAAAVLYRSLCNARDFIRSGESHVDKIRSEIERVIKREPQARIEYIEIVDGCTLDKITQLQGTVLIALAVRIGSIRLIDNLQLELSL